jgi:pantothenate kinase
MTQEEIERREFELAHKILLIIGDCADHLQIDQALEARGLPVSYDIEYVTKILTRIKDALPKPVH